MKNRLGIDPGASGGLAVVSQGGELLAVEKAPRSAPEVFELLSELRRDYGPFDAALEDIFGRSGQGQAAQGLIVQGKQHGWLEAALVALAIPYRVVHSRTWQGEWPSLRKKKPGETETEKKNRHKAEAMRLFPAETVTHWKADALLIAEWLRRQP